MSKTTKVTVSPRGPVVEIEQLFCPACDTLAIEEGRDFIGEGYRCPVCRHETTRKKMTRRVKRLEDWGGGGEAQPITVTAEDFSTAIRTSDPVTGGIPITPGDISQQWALFDGANEIPLQTTVLPHRSTPFLLLDFQTSMALGARKTFQLRPQAPTKSHATPITYAETSTTITVTTGSLVTEISKTTFNLLDGVWWNGVRKVDATATPNLTVRELGVDYSGRGTPTNVEWEYRGPLRGVLRVDGEYLDGVDNVISFTTRFTWYAGKSYIRLDHVLKNSFEDTERYVKLTDAKLSVKSPIAWTAITQSGALTYTDISVSLGVGMDLIPTTFEVTPSLGDYHLNNTITTATNLGMIIGDMSHHGATWVLEFEPSLSAGEKTRRTAVATDPLIALATPDRYADLNAFGIYGMSTYDDEKNAYRLWGWTWPVGGNAWSTEHDTAQLDPADVFVGMTNMSFDQENDNLWMSVVMFARTQLPQFMNRMRTWARFHKWEHAFRTDGFDYVSSWEREDYSDGNPVGGDRWTAAIYPTMTLDDDDYVEFNIRRAKPESTWPHAIGMFDYYYMTGDCDALEAGLDMAEKCEKMSAASSGPAGNARCEARELMVLICAWEATEEARWKTETDHMISQFVGAPYYDSRGFFWGVPPAPRAAGKGCTVFFDAECVAGLYRYYRATGDPDVLAQILQIGQFAYVNGLDAVIGWCGSRIVVDYPDADDILHLASGEYGGGAPEPFVASESAQYVNTLVIMYRETGNVDYLTRAKLHWAQGSKRHYNAPYATLIAGPTEVGKFVNQTEGAAVSPAYPEQGYLPPVTLLFREAVRAG